MSLKPKNSTEIHPNIKSEEQLQFLYDMRQLQPKQMFAVMQVLLEKMAKKEIQVKEKSNAQVGAMIAELYKKVQQKNYDSLFHLFRARIEEMLSEGYSVQPITDEDREQKRKFIEMADNVRKAGTAGWSANDQNLNDEHDDDGPNEAQQKEVKEAPQIIEETAPAAALEVTPAAEGTSSSFSQRKALQIQEDREARRGAKPEPKRQFISPEVNHSQIQNNRDQQWSKVNKGRPSNFTLPVNRMTKSLLWQNQLASNKFYVNNQSKRAQPIQSPGQEICDIVDLSVSGQIQVQEVDGFSEQEIQPIDLKPNFKMATKEERPLYNEADEESEAVDIKHPFYSVINDIVDYTKPVTSYRVPQEAKIKKFKLSTAAAYDDKDEEASLAKPTQFKSSFGPHYLTPKTVSRALRHKPLPNSLNQQATPLQTKVFHDALLTDLCNVKKIDQENAEIAQSQLMYKDDTQSIEVQYHCEIVTAIVEDFMQFIDFNHQIRIKDLLRMSSHQEAADYEHFSAPDVLQKFNSEVKSLSKQIARQCTGSKIWQIGHFSNTKYVRRIIAKGKCEKDDEPLVDFPLTLRPNLKELVIPRWKEQH